MTQPRNRIFIITVAAVLLGLLLLYGLIDPSGNYFPRCPVYQLTGYQCPGCGSQRAVHALLHGDMQSAWHYNAALFFFIPAILLMLVSEALRTRFPRLNTALTSPLAVSILLLLLTLWTIYRNL